MNKWFWLAAFIYLIGTSAAYSASAEGKTGLLTLGSEAPDFSLTDVVSGGTVSKDDLAAKKALLVVVLCRHCPYVQHVKEGLSQFGRDYADKDVAIVAVSSNNPADFPDDAPESLKEMALEAGLNFPVLFDESQELAKALTAVATPDFFLFDQDRKLVYRGQFDSSRPGKGGPVTGADLRAAVNALLEGKPVVSDQKPSFGCSIKWKPANEPAYAG